MLIITCPTGCASFCADIADIAAGTSGASTLRNEAQQVLGQGNSIYIQRAHPSGTGITECVEGDGLHPVSLTLREVTAWWQQRFSGTRREPGLVAYYLGLESATDSLHTRGDTVRECTDQGANLVSSLGEQRVMAIFGCTLDELPVCLEQYDRGFAETYASD